MEKTDKNVNNSLTNSPPPPSPSPPHRISTSSSSSSLSPLSDHSPNPNPKRITNSNSPNTITKASNNSETINNNNPDTVDKPTKNPIESQPDSRKSSTSSELSPLSSLGHGSPDLPPVSVSVPRIVEERRVGGGGGKGGGKVRKSLSILRAAEREKVVKRAALGLRVSGAVFCLVSLAVMASDKDKGWAGDSFYRYKEFRYCISVNVVGFLYSVAQIFDLAFTLCTGKYVLRHQYRFYFDFAMDQILTYLLMSSSSSAATRVDDWQSNWGKDAFPTMATVSVALSFMSFISLAASTLISGYALGTWGSS